MQLNAKLDGSRKFRLLQLTPALEASLREGTLRFKTSASSRDRVFLCTENSTHVVRKLKQSNSLLLSQPQSGSLEVFASPYELLETLETKPEINWSDFPEYKGLKQYKLACQPPTNYPTAAEYSCSDAEFKSQMLRQPAVKLDSTIWRVAPEVVHNIIVDIVSAMVERGDLELKSSLIDLDLQNGELPEVVRAVFDMFQGGDQGDEQHWIDKERLAIWIGLYVLRSNKQGLEKSVFLREWGLELPVKLDLSMNLLQGHAIETRPGWVKYIDPALLSTVPRARFDDLFALKKEWDLDEISPFLDDLVPPSAKLENWILKFARRRRQGSNTIISPMRR